MLLGGCLVSALHIGRTIPHGVLSVRRLVSHTCDSSTSSKQVHSRFKNSGSSVQKHSMVLKQTATTISDLPESISGVTKLYYRSSWLSWWLQIILTTVSGVVLTFANAVRQDDGKGFLAWASGSAVSSLGVALALVSAFWTWNVTRLARRISKGKVEQKYAIPLLRKYSQISVGISLVGMLLSLLGMEQIVGIIAAKLLTSTPLLAGGAATGLTTASVRAVDIFLVQACTNSLFAHFSSLVCYILLQLRLPAVIIK